MKKFVSTIMAVILAAFLVFTAACSSTVTYVITVQDMNDNPVEGVTVYLNSGETVLGSDTTDENGTAEISAEGGEYTITLENLPDGYNAPQVTTSVDGSPVTITISSSVLPGRAPTGTVYEEGDIIYDFEYTDAVTGETRTLSQSFEEGKRMVLLNFFYTTCGPCATEFPLMQNAYMQYDRLVDVIALSDYPLDSESGVAAYKNLMELTFHMGYDADGEIVANNFNITGYPTNVIIDRFGNICMIDAGAITDVNTFLLWFQRYTGDDYVPDIGNDFELEKPDIPNPDVSAIASAINDSSIDGKITYRWEEESEYTWPWVVGSDATYIQTSNAEKLGSNAIIYADITLDEGEVLAFDYRTSTELDSDIFYVFIDDSIVYEYSGSESTEYQTCYAFVGDGYEHELALAYVKDTGANVGEDTVFVKNMRVTDVAELDANGLSLDVLRQAASGYNEAEHTYTDYVEVVYNSEDGYYHVGSVDGPYLLANMIDDTQWGPGIYGQAMDALSVYNIGLYDETDPEYVLIGENVGSSLNPSYENYELIEKYAWYSRYSTFTDSLTPVTTELRDYLIELVSVLGNDNYADNETEWLEICRYFEQYGQAAEEITDPISGLTIETAEEAHMGDTQDVYMAPKSPRGAFFSFTPQVDGAYEFSTKDIVVTSGGESGTYLWLFNSDYGDIFEPDVVASAEDSSLVYELEAGVTYYIACALADPNVVGTCTLTINYYDEDYIIRPVASDVYSFNSETGEIFLPTYVDVRLMDDGYYYAFDGEENMGRVFVDFKSSTPFSNAALTSWIETTYRDENGNVTEIRHMFDFTEDGYYATSEDFSAIYEEVVPAEYRQDWTELMQNYADSANSFGYVEADVQLVEILKILMELEDRMTDNAWLQLCYYVEDLTVIDSAV